MKDNITTHSLTKHLSTKFESQNRDDRSEKYGTPVSTNYILSFVKMTGFFSVETTCFTMNKQLAK